MRYRGTEIDQATDLGGIYRMGKKDYYRGIGSGQDVMRMDTSIKKLKRIRQLAEGLEADCLKHIMEKESEIWDLKRRRDVFRLTQVDVNSLIAELEAEAGGDGDGCKSQQICVMTTTKEDREVRIDDIPQGTNKQMIDAAKAKCGKYLKLFKRPVKFEVKE